MGRGSLLTSDRLQPLLPAEDAFIPVRDRLLTRIGTADDQEHNISTFTRTTLDVTKERAADNVEATANAVLESLKLGLNLLEEMTTCSIRFSRLRLIRLLMKVS